jgi:hypothetical protein
VGIHETDFPSKSRSISKLLERAATCGLVAGAALVPVSQASAQTYSSGAGGDRIGDLIREFEQQKSHPLEGGGGRVLFKLMDGDWQYGEFRIKAGIFNQIKAVSAAQNFPLRVMLDIIARESSFNPKAKNESGACGLIQFTPATLYETIYQHASDFPEFAEHKLEDRVVKKRIDRGDGKGRKVVYEAHSPEDAEYLKTLCLDPQFNLSFGTHYKLRVAAVLQQYLDGIKPPGRDYYPLRPHELYLGFFAGAGAAEKIIRDVYLGRDLPATLYFSPAALANKANKKVLYKDDGTTARTGADILANIAASMGYDPSLRGKDMLPLPDVRAQVFKSEPAPRAIEDLIASP